MVWSCQASQGRAIFGVSALQIGSRYALESEIKLQLVTLLGWGFILGGDKGNMCGEGQPDRSKEHDGFSHCAMSWGPEQVVVGMLGAPRGVMVVNGQGDGAHHCQPFLSMVPPSHPSKEGP